ncbi:MAG: transcriptional repressor [Actinomycetia bacterium]|jgi:Fur family ferric uptake transcriptional regulator|nr:transcriptional repressor [Actinomycetes bacterium]
MAKQSAGAASGEGLEALLARRLREKGLRATPDRMRIFRVLARSAEPLTVRAVADRLRDDHLNITTVYRVMELFVALGIVHPVIVGHEAVGYELMAPFRPHHEHFLCAKCGRVVDIYDCPFEEAVAALSRDAGYEVTFHQMEMHGVCQACR